VSPALSDLPVRRVIRVLESAGFAYVHRGRGAGRALIGASERWAADRDCMFVALATRRGAPFYRALGYQESAIYLRKVLRHEPAE
jgi:GNAT superfamily N-acetyltransferase